MAVGKKTNAIVDKGGNELINILLTNRAIPTTLTANTNIFNLGHIASSTVEQQNSTTDFKSEDGEIQATEDDFTRQTTASLMQTDADLINYLGSTVKNTEILEIKYLGLRGGSDVWHFRIGNVTPQYNVTSPGGTTSMQYIHKGIGLSTDFTIATATMASIATALGLNTNSYFPTVAVTIPAAENFEVAEVS